MEFKTFIDKDMFKNLAGCIFVVEACTEAVKLLLLQNVPSTYYLWIAFLFSMIISFVRFLFNGDTTKEGIILSIINTVPIFLGSVGVYQVGIKSLEAFITG